MTVTLWGTHWPGRGSWHLPSPMWPPAVPDGHRNIQQPAGSQEGQQQGHHSTGGDPKTPDGGPGGVTRLGQRDIRACGTEGGAPCAGWQPTALDSEGWAGHRTARPYRSVTVPTCLTSDTRAMSLGCASSSLSPPAGLGEARDRGNDPKIALQQHSRARATAGGTEVTSGRARPALWWLWPGHGMGTRRG